MDQRRYQREQKRKKMKKVLILKIILCAVLILITTMIFNQKNAMKKKPSTKELITVDVIDDNNSPSESNSTEGYSDWNLILVNKWNPLPNEYNVDLVEVPGGERVDKRIYEPLMEMLEDAKDVNWNQLPKIISGYRTEQKQQQLFDAKVNTFKEMGYSNAKAIEEAELWVAYPRYSEHGLGSAVDINGATYDLFFWLQENSYKYGFIFRYPGSKTDLTGFSEEVWHYRYVGVDAATEMFEKGLSLEEYLQR